MVLQRIGSGSEKSTKANWESAMDQKEVVIVTGCSGFIGSALINKLAGRYVLVGFDKIAARQPPPAAECVCIDLTSEESMPAAFARISTGYGKRIASVVHLAAYFDLTGKPSELYDQITVHGTERLLKHLQDFEVEQFIFSSSMLVHAPTEPGAPIDEDSSLAPRWPYPQSKVDTEALIRAERGVIPVVLLRLAGIYDDRCHSAFLAQQISRIYEKQLIGHVYPGDIRHGQSALHLDDLMDGFQRLIEKRQQLPPELTLLLGEERTFAYDTLQRAIGLELHGQEWRTMTIPKAIAKTGAWIENDVLHEEPFIKPFMIDMADDHYELNISRARELIDWTPAQTLIDVVPKMTRAVRTDPPGWYRDNKLNAAQVAAARADAQGDKQDMKPDEHRKMMRHHVEAMRQMHLEMIWVHFLNILLGAWLVTTPFVFGAFDQTSFPEGILRVTQERGLWDPAWRSTALAWSDIASGVLVMLFSALSLSQRFSWAQWTNTLVGIWLLFAPLVFWSPSAAVYANDTLVGGLVIAFAVLVPMMPGMSHEGMMDQSDVPIGWTYCPSTYLQRLPIIALGALGFFIARTLAAYQMGHIDHVVDPFFGGTAGLNGTETIITSNVSKAWPVPDGGLGAVTYMFEILMGAMGDRRRWRTMPWMVTMFIFMVVPLGIVSIYFIIIQPIVIGTYCALCLLAALAMVIMIPYSLDELVAMGQYLVQSHRRSASFLRTFFMGGASPGSEQDRKADFGAAWAAMAESAIRGVTMPWPLLASAILGVWLMFSRLVFGTVPPLANSDHLVGALVVTVAVIAMAEVARALRFINVLFGAWLVVAPWLLLGGSAVAALVEVIAGLVLIALSLPRGHRSAEHYGGWDYYIA
jgi:nucleoside-diphosphate-sugar epimerase